MPAAAVKVPIRVEDQLEGVIDLVCCHLQEGCQRVSKCTDFLFFFNLKCYGRI
jgi:hypothetical protein